MVTFNEMKQKRKSRSFNRVPRAASIIAEVVGTDADNDRVTVKLSQVAADALKVEDAGKTFDISIKKAASDRQPNLSDLLGKTGGNIGQDMRVEAGSFLRLDNVTLDNKTNCLETSWANLAAGPRALANDPVKPELLSGMVKTSYNDYKTADGKDTRRWATEVMFTSKAVQVATVANLSSAVEKILGDQNPVGGTPQALVRLTLNDTGEPMHFYARKNWNKEAEALETPDAAVARFMQENDLEDLDMSNLTVEVVPMVRLFPGGETQKEINCRMGDNMKLPTFRGPSRYDITEVHGDQRRKNSAAVTSRKAASAKSLELVKTIAAERNRKPEFGDKPTQGQVAAWLQENGLQLGWAHGDVLVRFRTDRETGQTFSFPSACSTTTRTGIQLDAITTPYAPNHNEWLKSELQEARDVRQAAREDTVIVEGEPASSGQDDLSHGDLQESLADEPADTAAGPTPF